VDTSFPGLVRRLELLSSDATEVAVAAGAIVERLDVVGDGGRREVARLVDLLLDQFPLQAAEERLGHGRCDRQKRRQASDPNWVP
jgi:hypothetical protein